ncbi:YHYH domain-containing protein [Alkalibacillus sp. S2W]|uniref:YHYH domain-containing protein n=1 Tax=Alkalibacillus sp. S2W TaxID=3386553 RepID=UPI00398CC2E0
MNNKFLIILTMSIILLFPVSVFAHSGGTDSNGGHHCRTDCEKYGYEYGEYHYHNGSSSNYNDQNYNGSSSSGNENNFMGYLIVAGVTGLGVWFFTKKD